MRPQDIFKLVRKQFNKISKRSEGAVDFWEKQQEALKGIENTAGMQEIKEYWYRAFDEASNQLSQVDLIKEPAKGIKFQVKMREAREFLEFLDNVLA